MRVLIIDDSPLIRERLTEFLSALPGAEVVGSAANGRDGFEMAEHLAPDFVTLDLHMRDGNGFEFLDRVQGADISPHVAVLTNYFSEQYRKRCLSMGAVAFLDKSTQFEELQNLLLHLGESPGALCTEGVGR